MKQLLQLLLEQRGESGFMAARVNLLLARAYSAALLFSGVEMSINALRQYSLLQPTWFWICWVLVVGPMVGMFLSSWFYDDQPVWYLLHVFGVSFTLTTWVFQVGVGGQLPMDQTPWIWWSLGMAAMSAGFGLRKQWGWTFIAALPLAWVVLRTAHVGGSASYIRAVEDAIFTGLFSAVFTALIHTLKKDALEADLAMQNSAATAASQASRNARERERIRTTSLIHDRVIMTLEEAVKQRTKPQAEQVKNMALGAIQALNDWGKIAPSQDIDATSCFGAIAESVRLHSPQFVTDVSHDSEYLLPAEVAQTLTLATLEAVNNAIQHSKASEFTLRMSAGANGVKIVVRDNGRGFFQSRVSKSLMGIRTVIRGAMESIGGTAKIQSKEDTVGTTVILEWHHE